MKNIVKSAHRKKKVSSLRIRIHKEEHIIPKVGGRKKNANSLRVKHLKQPIYEYDR